MKIKSELEEIILLKSKEVKDKESENCKDAVDDIVKLTDRLIEIEKMESEKESENEDQKRQVVKERWQNGIAIAGIVIPATISIIGIHKTFKFDDAGGIISSSLGRGFINKLIPKK